MYSFIVFVLWLSFGEFNFISEVFVLFVVVCRKDYIGITVSMSVCLSVVLCWGVFDLFEIWKI